MSAALTPSAVTHGAGREPFAEEQSMQTAIAAPYSDDALRSVIRTWTYSADAIAAMSRRPDNDVRAQIDECVVELIQSKTLTFDEMVGRTGYSRGRLYRLQVERGLRVNEAKIRQRKHLRELQAEFLRACENETVAGDVLDVLAGLPDDSVDAVISSPPYNVAKAYESASDAMRPLRYFAWMCTIIDECERVLKPGGIIALVVGGTRDRNGTIVPLDWVLNDAFARTPLSFVNRIAWPTHAGLSPADRLAHRWEAIMVYSKGPASFNPNAARTPQKQYDKRAFKGATPGKATSFPLGAWPTDHWGDVNHIGHNHPEKTVHPAQFPVAIPKRLIALWTSPGALVLDMFSGSGSTHEACIQTGRRFVGCDLAYDAIRAARIAAAKPDLVSPLPGVTPESARFWAEEIAREAAGVAVWQLRAKRVEDDVPAISDAADRALCFDLFNTQEAAQGA